jgi:predicted nucleic acid-binding protein
MARVLADTNLWLRFADARSASHQLSLSGLSAISKAGHDICITPQVAVEFWVVATRPLEVNGLGWTPEKTDAFLNQVLGRSKMLDDSEQVFAEWRNLVRTHDIKGKRSHDARIAAIMATSGVQYLLTFNGPDFAVFPHVKVLHPSDVANGTAIIA